LRNNIPGRSQSFILDHPSRLSRANFRVVNKVALGKRALFKRGYKWRYSKQRKRLLSTPREVKGVEN